MATAAEQALTLEEDANSRDSGISMTSCGDEKQTQSPERNTDFSKVESSRHALSDCSNFVAKMKRNSSVSSSRSSSYYNFDTPTGRKKRSIFDTDSLDQSLYEKKNIFDKTLENHRKRSSASMSPGSALSDRKRSRNLTIAAPQSDKACRYNGASHLPKPAEPFCDDDDEVFTPYSQNTSSCHNTSAVFQAPAPRTATSLWDITPQTCIERQTSEGSANGSFHEKPKQIIRAMSVGVLDPDLPPMLEVRYSLPSVEYPQKASQAFRSISAITLLTEFQRLGRDFEKKYIIIDCRFPFEYKGGHVKGAINLFRHDKIKSTFFPDNVSVAPKKIPIFYCEYSQKRGPAMAHAVRSIDRVRNELRYPHVEYPEMYLLDYGYKSLWSLTECRQICEPQSYIPMNHSLYSSEFKSARLERHHSMASLKPNGDTGHREEKTKKCARSAIRRNNSTLSMLSRSSSDIHSSGLTSSSENILLDFDDQSDRRGSRWGSAIDVQSVGSEVDLDDAMDNGRERKKNEALSSTSSVGNLYIEHVVQLGIQITTPDFGEYGAKSSNETPIGENISLGLGGSNGTPCGTLDFSSVSDTD
uniref:M-phase inducer phosphatase n=1 Tax=Caenorhabditis tropicalis TaxID=1561998 RepID=A0A1I7UXJ9_9PELO